MFELGDEEINTFFIIIKIRNNYYNNLKYKKILVRAKQSKLIGTKDKIKPNNKDYQVQKKKIRSNHIDKPKHKDYSCSLL